MQTCNLCKIEKPSSEYYYNKSRKIYQKDCKLCFLQKQTIYRSNNKELIKERKRKAYAKDKEFYTSMLGSSKCNDIFSWRSLRHIGKTYHNWTILKLTGYANINHTHSKRSVVAEAQCICGTIATKKLNQFTNGSTFGCGCSRANSDREQIGFNLVKKSYRQSARKRNLELNLSNENMKNLFKSNCHYCGQFPNNQCVTKTGSIYLYNGIDRKNPDLGYTLDNCVPCCYTDNKAKMVMQYEDYLNHIKKVYEWISQSNLI